MAHKAAPVTARFLKLDVVEARLQVDQRHVPVAAQESSVPARLIELVLILTGQLIHRDNVLDHAERLPRLPLRDE